MFYLTTHSTHFIHGYIGVRHMVKNHSDSERGNPLLPHRLLFPLAARVLLHGPSHRQDNTYHCLCYTSHEALAGTRNSPMGPPWRIDPTTHRTTSERSYHGATSRSYKWNVKVHSPVFSLNESATRNSTPGLTSVCSGNRWTPCRVW